MKNDQKSILILLKEHSVRKRLAIAVCLFAVVMVFAVFWSLRISGLTLGEETATETSATETDSDATETDGDEEDNDSGTIDTTTKVTAMRALASTGSSYYFADAVDLDTAISSSGIDETYLVYTEINGTYYLVAADGTLTECTSSSSLGTSPNMFSGSENYIGWYTAESTLENYLWTLSSSSDEYAVYNSSTENYLAAGLKGRSNTQSVVSATTMVPMSLEGEGIIEYSIVPQGSRGGGIYYYTFYMEDESGNTVSIRTYLNTANGNTTIGLTVYGTTDYYTYGSMTLSDGNQLTTTITKTTAGIVINFTNETTGETIVYVFYGGLDFSETLSTYYVLTTGGLTISAVSYRENEVSETVTNVNTGTYSADNEGMKKFVYTTLSGDFDITYTFHDVSLGTNYWNNFFVQIADGTGYDDNNITVRADAFGWTGTDTNNSLTVNTISSVTWENWLSAMVSGKDCTVRIIRTGNTFVFIVSAGDLEFITCATVDAYEDVDAIVYLGGENCTLTNVALTNCTTRTRFNSYTRVTSSTDDDIYLNMTADSGSGGWTAEVTGASSEILYLIGQLSTENAIEWVTDTTAGASVEGTTSTLVSDSSQLRTVFYLARVRQCKVYFDGTNGGGTVYREGSQGGYTNDHHIDVTSYSMNSDGTIFYVDVPDLDYTPYWNNNNVYYYAYELKGWYDIYNSANNSEASSLSDISAIVQENYYEPGDTMELAYDSTANGATTTVCYADYIGTTYDAAIDSTTDAAYSAGLLTDRASSSDGTGGVNTSGFITTYVYDYSDIFNLYSAYLGDGSATTSAGVTTTTYKNLSGHQELWQLGGIVSGSQLTLGKSIFGSNVSYGFIFFNNAATENSSLYYLNRSSNYGNFNGGNTYIRIADITTTLSYLGVDLRSILFPDNTDDGGYAWHTISSDSGTITDTTNDSGTMGTTYVGTGNYLYQYDDETGYYYYDAARNAAFYSVTDQRFYLYDYTVRMYKYGSSATSTSDFLPFNYASADYTGTDEDGNTYSYGQVDYTQINYAFGTKSEIKFTLQDNVPYQGEVVTSDVNQALGRDMKFCFIGDDDLWVYLDDGTSDEELLLDIGGIHGEIYGEINFSAGTVEVVEFLSETLHISADGVITCENSTNTYTMTAAEKVTYEEFLGTDTEGVYIFIEKTDEDLYEITDLAKSISWAYTKTYMATTSSEAIESGEHTLSVYYMERGASESNLAIYLNLSSTYELQLLKAEATTAITKGATTNSELIANDAMLNDAVFKIYEVSSISDFSTSGYSTLKEYLEYLSTTSYGTVVGTYYMNDAENLSANGTTADGEDYQVTISDLRQEHTYYIVETEAPENYPLSGKVIQLYINDNGDVSITVYSSNGNVLETYYYDYSAETLTTSSSSGTSFVFSSGIEASYDTSEEKIVLAFAVLNALEYEIPVTGGMGTFHYRNVGISLVLASVTGLLILAFYHLVQTRIRRSCTNEYIKGYTKDGKMRGKRGKRFTRTRDHPLRGSNPVQDGGMQGQNASMSSANGGMERRRATGPGIR